MKKEILFIAVIFTYFTIVLESAPLDLASNISDCIDETPSRITIRHREHKGVGYETGYTTLETFLTPKWDRKFQPYADIRGHIMNDGNFAANIGLGSRVSPNEGLIIGGNLFFDYREISSMSSYQIGSGIELLSPYIDFNLNGYLPVGCKHHDSKTRFHRFKGEKILLTKTVESFLPSLYAELGGWIPNLSENFQLYIAAGPYYLGSRHIKVSRYKRIKVGSKLGGKYRISARIFEYLDAGIELTHDSLFHTNIQGYLGMSFPLGPSRLYRGFKKQDKTKKQSFFRRFRQRMSQSVYRNEIIPIYKKDVIFEAAKQNGQVVDFVFVDFSAKTMGEGTFEVPYQGINQAISCEITPSKPIIILNKQDSDSNPPCIVEQPSSPSISKLNRLIQNAYKINYD